MTRSHKSITIVAASSLTALLIFTFGWSNLFSVKSVEIVGAPTSQSMKALERSLSIKKGERLARVDPRAISHRLDSYRWIEDVSVKRNWLTGKILISLKARKPIAIFNEEAIDQKGNLFNLPGGVDKNLPRVTAQDLPSGLAAISLFSQLPIEFQKGISLLSASRLNDYLIYCTINGKDLRIKFGDEKNIALKIKVINSLLQLPENEKIKFMDLTAPHAPIVK